jgi:DNA-binding NtrC family response regulator
VEAIRAAGGTRIDLVVTDLRMPRLDGLGLLRELRRDHPDVPVILITAHGDDVSAAEAAGWGAVAFLQKPIRKDDILAIVARAIGPDPRPNTVGANRGTGV